METFLLLCSCRNTIKESINSAAAVPFKSKLGYQKTNRQNIFKCMALNHRQKLGHKIRSRAFWELLYLIYMETQVITQEKCRYRAIIIICMHCTEIKIISNAGRCALNILVDRIPSQLRKYLSILTQEGYSG